MKTLKIFTLLFLGSFAMNAQDLTKDAVPNEVMTAFESEYSNASDVEWEKTMDYFNVEFDLNRIDHEVWYTAAGEMVKLEKEVKKSDLPAAIKTELENEYAGFRVEDAELQKEDGVTTYRVELENGNQEKNVTFNDSGKVLNEYLD